MGKILFLIALLIVLTMSSCTHLVVQSVKQMSSLDSNFRKDSAVYAGIIVSDFKLNRVDSNFVSFQSLINNQTTSSADLDSVISRDSVIINKYKEKQINKNYNENYNIDTNDIIALDAPKNKQERTNITTKITSINSDFYPDSLIINAVVTDNNGNFISGLSSPYIDSNSSKKYWKYIIDSCKGDAYKINNLSVVEIRQQTSPAYSICYVLDHSGSMGEKRCIALQQAVRYTVGKVKASDYLSAIKFKGKVVEAVMPTADKENFKKGFLLNGMNGGGGTNILDALDSATNLLSTVPADFKRIIVLFSDGEASMKNYKSVISKIRQNHIKVFTVGYGMADYRSLVRIAKDTDGKMLKLNNIKDFANAFQYIYNTLSNYYKITYIPPECADLHKIKLTTDFPELALHNIEDYGEYDKSVFNEFAEIGTLTLLDIEFEYNKSSISPSSISQIIEISKQLTRSSNVIIEIGGHTDDIGSAVFNQQLSLERANSVKSELLRLGIDRKRLKVVGYGETKPIVPNDTDENRKRNRRTEFKIIEN